MSTTNITTAEQARALRNMAPRPQAALERAFGPLDRVNVEHVIERCHARDPTYIAPQEEHIAPHLCGWARAVGELEEVLSTCRIEKMSLDNVVLLDAIVRGELYDMCFFLVPLEKELESVILGIECALALQEIVHPADQAWHFAAREHIRGGLYRSPDFGGGTEMAMFTYDLIAVDASFGERAFFPTDHPLVDGGAKRNHTLHRPSEDSDVWPFVYDPPMPTLKLPLSPIKAAAYCLMHLQSMLPSQQSATASIRRRIALMEYLCRLVESATPSEWRKWHSIRPLHLPLPPPAPAVLNHASRVFMTSGSDSSLEQDEETISLLAGDAFPGDLQIFPGMSLTSAEREELEQLLAHLRDRTQEMSASEALMELRGACWKEQYDEHHQWKNDAEERLGQANYDRISADNERLYSGGRGHDMFDLEDHLACA